MKRHRPDVIDRVDQQIGSQEGMAINYANLGIIYQTRGDLDRAEKMFRQALEIHQQLGRKEGIAIQYANLGRVLEDRGNIEQARASWQTSRDLYAEVGIQQWVEKVESWLEALEENN